MVLHHAAGSTTRAELVVPAGDAVSPFGGSTAISVNTKLPDWCGKDIELQFMHCLPGNVPDLATSLSIPFEA